MLRQATVRMSESGTSTVIPIDRRRFSPGRVGLFLTVLGNMNCLVQVTGDDIFKDGYRPILGRWLDHDTLVDIGPPGATGNLEYPATGVRLAVFGHVSGFAELSVVQADN